MLKLLRKEKESIRIGKDITVVVLQSGKGHVTFGIAAPDDVNILRDNAIERSPRKPCIKTG